MNLDFRPSVKAFSVNVLGVAHVMGHEYRSVKVFLCEILLFTDSCNISLSKVSGYTRYIKLLAIGNVAR